NTMEKTFVFGSHTDVGLQREKNEDYFSYFESANGDIFVICDGMGGHVGGATASRLAIDSIREHLQGKYFEEPKEALAQSLQFANLQIFDQAQNSPALSGMGTTCVILLIRATQAYYAHVGDSRLYLWHKDTLQLLTKDHSVVQQLVDQGTITPEEASNHPNRNELSRAMGVAAIVEVEVSSSPYIVQKDDKFLLCSDGLTAHLTDTTLQQVLSRQDTPQEKALQLVAQANQQGGIDNITVQVIDFQHITLPPNTSRKAWKKLKPWLFPFLIIALLATVFMAQYLREQRIQAEIDQKVADSLAIVAAEKWTTDSLTKVDEHPDTLIIHRIKKGESLARIGKRYNVAIDSLVDWNGIDEVEKIAVGIPLKIKAKMVYTLEKPQTLETLYEERFKRWENYDVTLKSLRRANSTPNDSLVGVLPKGKKIIIPDLRVIYM
ncbi:MAG: Stp1/IreP family PP2C-type Ser/Thr phosphatase, partial [Bacteroidota bacterium]